MLCIPAVSAVTFARFSSGTACQSPRLSSTSISILSPSIPFLPPATPIWPCTRFTLHFVLRRQVHHILSSPLRARPAIFLFSCDPQSAHRWRKFSPTLPKQQHMTTKRAPSNEAGNAIFGGRPFLLVFCTHTSPSPPSLAPLSSASSLPTEHWLKPGPCSDVRPWWAGPRRH